MTKQKSNGVEDLLQLIRQVEGNLGQYADYDRQQFRADVTQALELYLEDTLSQGKNPTMAGFSKLVKTIKENPDSLRNTPYARFAPFHLTLNEDL